MVLKMPRPTQRKPGAPFYFRVRVPADLVDSVGRRELSYSLQTNEEAEAKRLFAAEMAKHLAHWEALRKGPQPIPLQTITALCGEFYREWVQSLTAEPGPAGVWTGISEINKRLSGLEGEERQQALADWYGLTADGLLLRHGLVPDEFSYRRLLDHLHDTVTRATETLSRRAEGDYGPDPHENRFPASVVVPSPPPQAPRRKPGASLSGLFAEWEKQARADGKPEKTIRDFRHKVEELRAFLKHERIPDIRPADIVRWLDYLRDEKKLSGKTIGQKYLAAVRLMFSFAKSRAMGLPDPTEGLKVKIPKRQTTRDKGFTDQEARQILAAARRGAGISERMADHMRRAYRWVPWICAHTGARVNEITQIRREDLLTVDGIPCLCITPDAGAVKTGQHRIVPLHPQLVRDGLVEEMKALPRGPVFHVAGKSAKGTGGRLAGWVREHAKITDPALQPNHAWRHRMKTVCRRVGIDGEWADHLQGHANPRASGGYGEWEVAALYREVCKLPDYDA